MYNKIYVNCGVQIPDGITDSLQTDLSDAIQIGIRVDETINIEQCHFLQFITHQAPDYYAFNLDRTVQWEQEINDHMTDPTIPRWKVDSAGHPNPLYESGGAHVIDGDTCCIYDQPEYVLGIHPRIIGCTFIIANDTVIGRVLWSRQNEVKGPDQETVSTYQVDIKPIDRIPDWALLTLQNSYGTNDFRTPEYNIPESLAREITQPHDTAIEEAKIDLQCLPPPPDWVLLHHPSFSQLMPTGAAPDAVVVEDHTEEQLRHHPYLLLQNPRHT
jgi:hypothetical protein